jgi:AraC-like DNA-binding protein
MKQIGSLAKERFEQIVIENEMLRAGFAAMPYMVLRDTRLSVGARLAYAVLLMYAWQEGACFPGQERMAADMGVSSRHLRRYLQELENSSYVRVEQQGLNKPNRYMIRDVSTKLKKGQNRGGPDAGVRSRADIDVRSRPDADVRLIDSD